jgi:pimeloyl-ACP methyl ester carboxylesterase
MSDPAPLEELTVERLAADVPALANALDLDEYALLGHSFGGLVALTVALAGGPSRVVLSCTAASVRHHRRMETPYSSFDDVIRRQFRDGDSELANTYLRRRAPEVLKSEIFMHMVGTAFGGFDVESRLGEIPMPALVLAGRHDRAIPVEAAELIAREIPDAQLVVFEQSAHIPFVEEQDAYVDAVKRFVGRSGETTS